MNKKFILLFILMQLSINCKTEVLRVDNGSGSELYYLESKNEVCKEKSSYHQWYALFGYYKIYGKSGSELFPDHNKDISYKVIHKMEWWDAIMSFVGPIMVTITKRTTIVEKCTNLSLYFATEEDYNDLQNQRKDKIRADLDYKLQADKSDSARQLYHESEAKYAKWIKDFLEEKEIVYEKKWREEIAKSGNKKILIMDREGKILVGKISRISRDSVSVEKPEGGIVEVSRYTLYKVHFPKK